MKHSRTISKAFLLDGKYRHSAQIIQLATDCRDSSCWFVKFVESLSIRLKRNEGCDCEPSGLEDKLITIFINVCLCFIRGY